MGSIGRLAMRLCQPDASRLVLQRGAEVLAEALARREDE